MPSKWDPLRDSRLGTHLRSNSKWHGINMTCQHSSFPICLNLTSALKLFLDKKEKKTWGEVAAWTWHAPSVTRGLWPSPGLCTVTEQTNSVSVKYYLNSDYVCCSTISSKSIQMSCLTWEAHLQLCVSLQTAGAVHNVHQMDGRPGEGHSVATQTLAELFRLAAQLLQLLFVLQLNSKVYLWHRSELLV